MNISKIDDKKQQLLRDLIDHISDPIHRRIIEAYEFDRPLESIESEFIKILLEACDED